jgi:cobalt-precorrin 5A hydrolase / precorrin-3B C17-methyltransferase
MMVAPPRRLVAGIGCTGSATTSEIVALLERTLAEAGKTTLGLACLASLDSRAGIAALSEAARQLGIPLRFFTAAELAAAGPALATPSAVVAERTGIAGIAEAIALQAGTLLVSKRKSPQATCAIGLATTPFDVGQFGRGAP